MTTPPKPEFAVGTASDGQPVIYEVEPQPPAGEVEGRVAALVAAVEPFTVDGGVSCGREEQDALVAAYEQLKEGTNHA